MGRTKKVEAIEIAEQATATVDQATEAAVQTSEYVWLNYLTMKCMRLRKSAKGKDFYSISAPYPEADANDKGQRFCSFAVNMGQVKAAETKEHVENPAFKNIFLGKADQERTISYKKDGEYVQAKITNGELKRLFEENRKGFKAVTAEA